MDAAHVLDALRRGDSPGAEALAWFARGLASGAVSDAQAGAFAMGICLQGLSDAERVALTRAMRDSGDVLSWDLPGPVVDKHSTGGIGDCTSLIIAPAVAACGVYVPMISGRGLGHTGGTLDKLDAIPGYATAPGDARFREVVAQVGCAIVGTTDTIAPADRRLYAVRDVTATVQSVDLICASILSKKLAAGLEALVLDVKVGSGAFMKTREAAQVLGRAMADTANGAGCKTAVLLTAMDAPLAPALGNAVEVAAVMAVLTGGDTGPLYELSVALAAEALTQAGVADGEAKIAKAIASGAAAEKFGAMVYALGGPKSFVEDWRRFLPEANVIQEVPAPRAGYVAAFDGEALGRAVVRLGGGRQVETDMIDPAVGLSEVVPLGARVEQGQPLAILHASREDQAMAAAQAVQSAITLSETPPAAGPRVIERIT